MSLSQIGQVGLLELDDFDDFVAALRAIEGALVMIGLASHRADASEHHARAAPWTVRPFDRVRIRRCWRENRHGPPLGLSIVRLGTIRSQSDNAKSGHGQIQITPLEGKTGQHPTPGTVRIRTVVSGT